MTRPAPEIFVDVADSSAVVLSDEAIDAFADLLLSLVEDQEGDQCEAS